MASTTNKALLDYRIERYEEMRFTHREATILANSIGEDGFALDYRKVRKALAQGCKHRLAVRIFENLRELTHESEESSEEVAVTN